MDKTLYVSYQYFKENPEHGIVVHLKNGDELFYQTMVSSYRPFHPKWGDSQPAAYINQSDIAKYEDLKSYITTKGIDLDITSPKLFLKLTEKYILPDVMRETINNDVERLMPSPNIQVLEPVRVSTKKMF